MNKICSIVLIMIIFFSSMTFYISCSSAYSDERISVYFYFSWMNEDGTWQERNISQEGYMRKQALSFGQPVKCRIVVIPHTKCVFGFRLHEIGNLPAFDIIEGTYNAIELGNGFDARPPETDLDHLRELASKHLGKPPRYMHYNETLEYTWVLMPNENYKDQQWTGLSVDCLFHAQSFKTGNDVHIGVSFTEAVISGEWTGPSYTPSNGQTTENGESTNDSTPTSSIPGFTLPALLLSLIGVSYFIKKKKKN